MKIRRIDMIVILVIVAIIVGVIIIYPNFFAKDKENKAVQSSNDKTTLIVKSSVIAMNTLSNPEIKDIKDFLKRAETLYEAQNKNVDVKVIQFEQTKEDSEIEGSFGTDSAVDVLFKEYFNMSTYIHTGKVVPLDDIITDEIRNDFDDNYWENSKYDGRTYMMPFLTMQNVMAYNKDLFREAGLEEFVSDEDIIQTWTLDEWETILKKLQENLPSSTFPMMMYGKNNQGDTHIMTLLRSEGCKFFDENGKISLNNPEGIKAIQKIMDWNEQGYFPINSQNLEINDCYDLFYNGQLAIYLTNISLDESLKASNINYGHVNFPSVDGKGLTTNFLSGFEVFDNGNSKKVEVAKDFVKFIYENEELLDMSTGGIPCSKRVIEKYDDLLVNEKKYILNSNNGWNFTGNNPSWRSVREVFYPNIQDLLYGTKSAEEIAKQIEETCNSALEEGYKNSVVHK